MTVTAITGAGAVVTKIEARRSMFNQHYVTTLKKVRRRLINVRIKIWFLITAAKFELREGEKLNHLKKPDIFKLGFKRCMICHQASKFYSVSDNVSHERS